MTGGWSRLSVLLVTRRVTIDRVAVELNEKLGKACDIVRYNMTMKVVLVIVPQVISPLVNGPLQRTLH